jgi:hypothetical protein
MRPLLLPDPVPVPAPLPAAAASAPPFLLSLGAKDFAMPSPPPRQLHLSAFLMKAGHHDAAWRHPLTEPERVTDLTYFQQLARTAERACSTRCSSPMV